MDVLKQVTLLLIVLSVLLLIRPSIYPAPDSSV